MTTEPSLSLSRKRKRWGRVIKIVYEVVVTHPLLLLLCCSSFVLHHRKCREQEVAEEWVVFVERVAPDLRNLAQLFWGGDDAGCLSDSKDAAAPTTAV